MPENIYLLLDLDGTIIVDKHYLSDYRKVELLPGAAEGLLKLKDLGIKFIIITNQSGLARRYFSKEDLFNIHKRVVEMLNDKGIQIEDLFFCPHHPDDNCQCRKPGTKLAEDAAQKYDFDFKKSFVIGDKKSDIILGNKIGAITFFIKSDEQKIVMESDDSIPDFIVNNINDAALIIKSLLLS
jgi:D-glycero-D-manno-heptose 1,7-bisphosphate phosphatase